MYVLGVGGEAGSYLRLIDLVYHSTLGLRVIKKKKVRGNTAHVLQGVGIQEEKIG